MCRHFGWTAAAAFSIALAAAGCGGSEQPHPAAAPAAAAATGPRVDPATAGEVKGTVAVNGAVPANERIRMIADPACSRQAQGDQFQETYVVGPDGTLGNVFVYVKDGLGSYSYDPATTAIVLDQQGCRYHPHVFGIRVGQPLEITNSDPTLHNIHAIPKSNTEFNNGQPIQGMKTTHTFTQPEVMIPFKCDVHGWMNAYIGVLDHPFFAVTAADGAFSLKGLPAGTYTIEAWHEKLGTLTQRVTIGATESKDVAFTFQATASTN